MKSETTKIDLWIKSRLLNDIYYRVTIWSLVSIATYLILSHQPGFSVVEFFKSYVPKRIDLINIAFPLAFIFTLTATLFKDMAIYENSLWAEDKLFGIVGMVVRKLCSEALLWSAALAYGVCFIIVITLIQILPHERNVPPVALERMLALIVLFFVITAVNLGCYYFIRREGRSFFLELTNQKYIPPLLYVVAILFGIGWIYLGA